MTEMQADQTERSLQERCAIIEIIQYLSTETNFPNILNMAIGKIMEVIEPAETGMIFLWDDSICLFRPCAVVGYDPTVFKAIGLQIDESLLGQVFSLRKTSLYTSSVEIEKILQFIRPANQKIWRQALGKEYLPRSILAAPICSGNQIHGFLLLEVLEGSENFSQQDLNFLQVSADLISLSAERARSGLMMTASADNHMVGQIQSEWIETLSHELGMPLTAIKGYATALMLDEVKWSVTKRKEFLQLIEDESDQIEILLRDLLTSTLIDADTFYFEPESLQIAQIAQAIAEEMEHRTEKHRLIVDFPPNLPLVKADPRWIRQVFRNLLDNAIKYSPDGGLIVIRGEVRSSDAVIHISDQGIGIPSEDLILIFDKYVRAKSYDSTQVPGTGLGLPIARAIVEAHGGRIWANSKVNEGTTLSFSIPLDEYCKEAIGDRNESGTDPDRR
jgi:K+-sensing histidine kinase KdpD